MIKPASAADRVIVGRVATLQGERGYGWSEAIAIAAGRVVAVGAAPDVLQWVGPGTTVWKLSPATVVLPSLTDAHLHLGAAARSAGQPDLSGADSGSVQEIVLKAHRERSAAGDGDGWLLGHGWSLDALGVAPRAAMLDATAPGRPVALWSHDHHSRWLNSEALRLGGFGERPDPSRGRIERDQHGRATGLLLEAAAGLIDAIIPEPDAGATMGRLVAFAATLASLGVTSVHDPGGLAPDPELRGGPLFYRELDATGELPLRVAACVREEQLDGAIEIGFRTGQGAAPHADGDRARYRDGWLKIFSDGALGSRTAALLEPYEPSDGAGESRGGATGMLLRSQGELRQLTRRAAGAGIASQIHAIGDAAVRTALDALVGLPGVGGAMHRLEHAQLIDPLDITRFAELGIAASVQPCHLISDAEAARSAWGRRTTTAFPFGSLAATDATMPFGTDAPVESPDPWPGIAAAVTRRGYDWPEVDAFHPEQAISLERALRGACLDGPRSLGVGDEGHLGVGARADLVVLPAAAFADPVAAAPLASLRPLVTLLDGRVVWRQPGFDP